MTPKTGLPHISIDSFLRFDLHMMCDGEEWIIYLPNQLLQEFKAGLLILRQGSFIADCSGFFVRQAAENCRIAAMLPKPQITSFLDCFLINSYPIIIING